MPDTPYPINGTIKTSENIAVANNRIIFTSPNGSVSALTDSSGKYLVDLSNAGYTAGDTVTYSITGPFNNETKEGSFTVTGASKTLNSTTIVRTDKVDPGGVNDIQIHNIGGKPVSRDNRFPVEAELDVGDIQIGAVEIKDGTTDYRASVNIDGAQLVYQTSVPNTEVTITDGTDSLNLSELKQEDTSLNLKEVITQLKITNMHLAILSDNLIDKEEI